MSSRLTTTRCSSGSLWFAVRQRQTEIVARPDFRDLTDDDVVFIDHHYLVVNKPRGLPVHATPDPQRPHLERLTEHLLGQTGLSAVHRLDVWTSGVVVIARTADGRRALSRLFADGAVTKVYEAVCVGRPDEPSGQLRHYLTKRREKGRDVMRSVRSGGKVAITDYELIRQVGPYSLIRLEPKTGRTHQLRVQAALAGWPVLGDELYGHPERDPERELEGQLLHARSLAFSDPLTGDDRIFEEPPPGLFARFIPR